MHVNIITKPKLEDIFVYAFSLLHIFVVVFLN